MKKVKITKEQAIHLMKLGASGFQNGNLDVMIKEAIDEGLFKKEGTKQPELKGISDAFQNFTDELKSMGL